MKRFLLLSSIFALPFFAIVIYYCFFVVGNVTGDLGKLQEIPFGSEYVELLENNYPEISVVTDYIPGMEYSQFGIISVGDSFSKQGIYGFQNYLALSRGCQALNLNSRSTPEQTALGLLKNGFFDDMQIECIVVESAMSKFIGRLGGLDFDNTSDVGKILYDRKPLVFNVDDGKMSINRIFRFINGLFHLRRPVLRTELTIDAFEYPKSPRRLFYYNDDLFFRKDIGNIDKARENVVRLKGEFDKAGIELIYMVAANKYSVYQDYMKEPKWGRNMLMSEFTELSSEGWFVDTQNILTEMVPRVKDVYMMNDSHWSYKASRKIAETIDEYLDGSPDSDPLY